MSYTIEQLQAVQGAPIYAEDGDPIGKVDAVYADYETGKPEWLAAGTGLFNMKRVLVPVEGATVEDDCVRVPFSKDLVKGSPDIDETRIDQDTENALLKHYGVGYPQEQSQSAQNPADSDTQTLTRSEEELVVGKRSTEAGRVRLHKRVLTEPAEGQVELRTEQAEVRREPIDAPAAPQAQIGEQEVEVALQREEAVVEKRTVPKEKVTVAKQGVTNQETISDTVRKEQIEVEGDGVEEMGTPE
jgi:uncharacterized protein (TIGR02271 family)